MKNTITIEHIHSLISHETYARFGYKTTVCFLILKNGFEVVGSSACVDPSNYDETVGRKIAKEDAVNKLWSLEGYRLQYDLNTV